MPNSSRRCRSCTDGACEDCIWSSDMTADCCCVSSLPFGDPDAIYTNEYGDSELADVYEAELDLACRRRPGR